MQPRGGKSSMVFGQKKRVPPFCFAAVTKQGPDSGGKAILLSSVICKGSSIEIRWDGR